jgi:hypothetical protein
MGVRHDGRSSGQIVEVFDGFCESQAVEVTEDITVVPELLDDLKVSFGLDLHGGRERFIANGEGDLACRLELDLPRLGNPF